MKKQISSSKLISLIFSISVLCFSVVSLTYAAWTAPGELPPAGNVAVILNASGTTQAKIGNLILNCGTGLNCNDPISASTIGLLVPYGKVGIGTMTPAAPLHVVGVNFQGIRISGGANERLTLVSSDDSTNMWNLDNNAGTLRFFRDDYNANGFGANGEVKMVITNDGKVGIGTTSPPGTKLEVNGNLSLMQNALVVDFNNGGVDTLVEGDVVVVNNAANLSVKKTTTAGDKKVVGAVVVGGAAGSTVKVAIGGIFTVKVTSATAIGSHLKASSTSGSAVTTGDTGTNAGGDFAFALTSTTGAGTVKAVFIKAETY